MAGQMTHEIEYKWKLNNKNGFARFLNHALQLGARLGAAKNILNRDLYLDTPERLFAQHHTKCRLRKSNGRFELTFKTSSPLIDGLVRRREKNTKLPPFRSSVDALKYCREKILQNTLDKRPLEILFQIDNRRVTRKLTLPDGTIAELSFDDVTISRKKKKVKMLEIELELMRGNLKRLKAFAEQLTKNSTLKFQTRSKVATAGRAFSL